MLIENLKAGEVIPIFRSLGECNDTFDLFDDLTDGGSQNHTMVFEAAPFDKRTARRSLLVISSCLRITCRGIQVRIEALNRNGASIFPWLMRRLAGRTRVSTAGGVLSACFAPPNVQHFDAATNQPNPTDLLRNLLMDIRLHKGDPSMGPCLVGFFAKDALDLGSNSDDETDPVWPNFEVWVPDQVVWVNHAESSAIAVGFVFGGEHAAAAYKEATESIAQMTAKTRILSDELLGWDEESRHSSFLQIPLHGEELPEAPPKPTAEVSPTLAQTQRALEDIRTALERGHVLRAAASRRYSLPLHKPFKAYRRLRRMNPSSHMYLVNDTERCLFGTVAKTSISVSAETRTLTIRSVCGVAPRGRTPDGLIDFEKDNRIECDMLLDPTFVDDHMIAVDLARADLARVCKIGSRRVDRLLSIEKVPGEMQLVSYVRGELADDFDALRAFYSIENHRHLVGAPLFSARKIVKKHEPQPPSLFRGFLGYITKDNGFEGVQVDRAVQVCNSRADIDCALELGRSTDPKQCIDTTRQIARPIIEIIKEVG